MARGILYKSQVKRLLSGKNVVDGTGRKYYVGEGELKEDLKFVDEHDLYDKVEIFFEYGNIEIVVKEEYRKK